MARVWYVGTYPYREITPQDWDKVGLFGPHYQWSADNGWSVDESLFRPELLAYLANDPEFQLGKTGVRPDTPLPPDDVTRPWKVDPEILALVDDAFEALSLAEDALEDISDSLASANAAATKAGTYRNEAQGFRNEAETFKTAAGTSASSASSSAATATTKAGEASVSAAAAGASETNAGISEDNAKISEDNAKVSEGNAKVSENNAKTSETNSKASELSAKKSRDDAEVFRDQARSSVLRWVGEWSSSTAYLKYDVVGYQGASWLAASNSTAVTPGGGHPEWILLAAKGDKGEDGTVTQEMLDDAVSTLVGAAPEALNALDELAAALGNDPNFAATVNGKIAERVKTVDMNVALDLKADKTDPRFTDSRNPTPHSHTVESISASGSASSSTFLRGDGAWASPPDTTYPTITQAEAENSAHAIGRLVTGQRLRQSANAAITARIVPVTSFPASPDPNILYLKVE